MTNKYGFNIQYSYRHLPEIFYKDQKPYSFSKASYVLLNEPLVNDLGLNYNHLKTNEGLQYLLGNTNDKLVKPLSMAYAGHQYANFNILGDGRAHLVFEHLYKNTLYDFHLKGSGQTSFSRGFDGRATLRSALVEYLMSVAMDALNVPTTKTLAVIKTGDKINRIGLQDGAILVRVAKSHLRVGTFEYAVYKNDLNALKALTDYAIKRHDQDLYKTEDAYIKWYDRVIRRQAELIAHWQSIGFVHGVMNTDNMTINGETIDYGPCAFIDELDFKAVYSSIDHEGRYAFGNQPYIGSWNLAKLGQMILPLIDEDNKKAIEKVQISLEKYGAYFENHYYKLMAKKLGIDHFKKNDVTLIDNLLKLMEYYKADYTQTFYALSYSNYPDHDFFKSTEFINWKAQWKKRIDQIASSYEIMRENNPVVIPRNHLVKSVLDRVIDEGNIEVFNQLIERLKTPFNPNIEDEYKLPPKVKSPYVTYCGT